MSTATLSPLKRGDFFVNECTRVQLARALAVAAALRELRRYMAQVGRHGPLVANRALAMVGRAQRIEARAAVALARKIKAERERYDE